MQRLEGAEKVSVDFGERLGTIVAAKDFKLAPSKIREAIEDSGFRVSGISISASGEIFREGGKAYLALNEKQRLPLVQNELLKGRREGKIRGRFRLLDETEKGFKLELVEILEASRE